MSATRSAGTLPAISADRVAVITVDRCSDTAAILMCAVERRHTYPTMNPVCRLVDLRVNPGGAGELGGSRDGQRMCLARPRSGMAP